MIALALAILFATVILEDLQESNRDRGFMSSLGPWFTNLWRRKYWWLHVSGMAVSDHYEPESDYTVMGPKKWWALVGLAAFVDWWHFLKFVRVCVFAYLLTLVMVIAWWWFLPIWALYGATHEFYYNRMFNPEWWAKWREK